MPRSEVWTETHLLPMRIECQMEHDGSITMALPGYCLRPVTVTGATKRAALADLYDRMAMDMGRPVSNTQLN